MSGLPSWTIHAASERRCTARGLGSSGNIAWAITGSSARSKTIVWWFLSSASEIAKKSIVRALPETVLVIQLLESAAAKENPCGTEMVDCGTRQAPIEPQPHRACGRGKTLLSTEG